jgi:hypothetical protein
MPATTAGEIVFRKSKTLHCPKVGAAQRRELAEARKALLGSG